jgi:hypothetical protein
MIFREIICVIILQGKIKIIMFEKKLIQKIIDAWNSDQNHPGRGRNINPVPELATISKLIEIAFITSLEKEEDKPITFSLSLFNKEMLKKTGLSMQFKNPVPLNVEALTKLSPVIDPEMSLFAISKDEMSNDLFICGVVSFSQQKNRFNKIPGQTGNNNFLRPDVFTITTIRPGSLLITRGNSQIGRFVKGDFIVATPSPFDTVAMGEYIFSSVKQHKLYEKHGNLYWKFYLDSLAFLLSEISLRSHGATVVFVNEGHLPEENGFIHGYKFSKSIGVKGLLSRYMNYTGKDITRDIEMRKNISERLMLIAQYACIDGALILSDQFDMISFGTKLYTNTWNGKVLVGPDGFSSGGAPFRYDQHGTRHKSAIDYTGSNENSVVFVISQDGPVRGFVKKDNDTILCWPDCTVSMFI